jgi:hypothetical protein
MVFINFLNLSSIYLREKSRIDRLQIKTGDIFLLHTKRCPDCRNEKQKRTRIFHENL